MPVEQSAPTLANRRPGLEHGPSGTLASIGVPVFNGARFLRQTLDSLLQQDYTPFELVVSDNASTDDTERIVREYAERDSRIR